MVMTGAICCRILCSLWLLAPVAMPGDAERVRPGRARPLRPTWDVEVPRLAGPGGIDRGLDDLVDVLRRSVIGRSLAVGLVGGDAAAPWLHELRPFQEGRSYPLQELVDLTARVESRSAASRIARFRVVADARGRWRPEIEVARVGGGEDRGSSALPLLRQLVSGLRASPESRQLRLTLLDVVTGEPPGIVIAGSTRDASAYHRLLNHLLGEELLVGITPGDLRRRRDGRVDFGPTRLVLARQPLARL